MDAREAYEILGLPLGSTEDEVRRAFRRLSRQTHPDVGGSGPIFRMVNDAYDALRAPMQNVDGSEGPSHHHHFSDPPASSDGTTGSSQTSPASNVSRRDFERFFKWHVKRMPILQAVMTDIAFFGEQISSFDDGQIISAEFEHEVRPTVNRLRRSMSELRRSYRNPPIIVANLIGKMVDSGSAAIAAISARPATADAMKLATYQIRRFNEALDQLSDFIASARG